MFCDFHDVALHDDNSSDWSTGRLSSKDRLKVVLNHAVVSIGIYSYFQWL